MFIIFNVFISTIILKKVGSTISKLKKSIQTSSAYLSIPIKKTKKCPARLIVTSHPHSVNSERFRALRTNLLFGQRTQGIISVLITSSVLSEGKSFVAVNLGTVLAQTNKKVLLVDADLRKPTLHTILILENEEGLTSILLEETLDAVKVIQFASTSNLHFLLYPSNSSKLLISTQR